MSLGAVAACGHKPVSSRSQLSTTCKPRIIRAGSTRTAGLSTLSSTTQANFTLTVTDTTVRGYIIAARGRPYWFAGSVYGGGVVRNGASGKREDTYRAGSYSYTVVYDSVTNTAELAGTRIALDTGNVLLLDRVDSVGGLPQVIGALCAPEIRLDGPVRPLLDLLPGLRAFAGVDAGA